MLDDDDNREVSDAGKALLGLVATIAALGLIGAISGLLSLAILYRRRK
jgi:hypothetical protein